MEEYESVVIIKDNASKEEIEEVINKVKEIVIVREVNELGKRKLAYEFKGYKEGYYIQFFINAEKFQIVKLEDYYREENAVLKYLTVKQN